MCFFFFSSRRRHTRLQGDWSSDVCSSDLVPERPTAAWNPIAGFTDATGRLLWSGLSDGALFPQPYGGGFAENRVRLATTETQTGNLAVPVDAIVPEAGNRPPPQGGPGQTGAGEPTEPRPRPADPPRGRGAGPRAPFGPGPPLPRG